MTFVYGLILIIGLSVFYGVSLSVNAQTAVPEGCSQLLAQCGTCHDVSCGHYDHNRNEER